MREDEIRVAVVLVARTLDAFWKLPDCEVHPADDERRERMVVPVTRDEDRLQVLAAVTESFHEQDWRRDHRGGGV